MWLPTAPADLLAYEFWLASVNDPVGSPEGYPVGNPVGSSVGNPVSNPVGNPVANPVGNPEARREEEARRGQKRPGSQVAQPKTPETTDLEIYSFWSSMGSPL